MILFVPNKLSMLTFCVLLFLYSHIAYATDYSNIENNIISEQRQVELHNLIIQDCGSCHGMTLKGGLGPALTYDALANKSRRMIELTILNGRPGTPMPPWNTVLTKQEVNWLVDTLYAGVLP